MPSGSGCVWNDRSEVDRMVQKPPRSASDLHIAGLLDLLNNSEADDRLNAQPPVETASALPHPMERGSLPEVTSTAAEPVDLPDYPDNADNRFAAHIVFGLSKLKRS
jgi:hypothetical protein